MSKSLSEMSLEELWELFPITLVKHQNQWSRWYDEERNILLEILKDKEVTRISHIGSTAIKEIWAKPIIDILVEVTYNINMKSLKELLVENQYICMSEDKNRISLNKGYTEDGFAEKVYHIHLRYLGDNNELYFRDYLNDTPFVAKQYEELKLSLWKQYEHNRDGYTKAKGDFISTFTKKAKVKYIDKY